MSIDEKNFFWVVANDMFRPTKIIWSQDTIISKHYNRTNMYPRCREENNITEKSILYPGNADGKKTDDMVCKAHSLRNYKRYDPNSLENIKKFNERS